MRFTLMYEGALPSGDKAKRDDKHNIRLALHPQLKKLWELPPLSYVADIKNPDVNGCNRFTKETDPGIFDFGSLPNIISTIDGIDFVPIVHESLAIVAELDITFMFPSITLPSATAICTRDIDNKLKTLFDGLRMPKQLQELPENWRPNSDTTPLYCLLQDDSMIVKISVATEYALKSMNENDVLVIIRVLIRAKMGTLYNLALIG